METILIKNSRTDYGTILSLQKRLFSEKIARKKQGLVSPNYLLFNEHNPVITLGLHAHAQNILYPKEQLEKEGIELYYIDRGGDVTYHGPGQWTVYPIFDLEAMGIGLKEYVHKLEEVAIITAALYGVKATRIPGASGAWVDVDGNHPRKICAIGIRASHFITMHGIAFNVHTAPSAFRWINPCGFTDKGVTCLALETDKTCRMEEVQSKLIESFNDVFQLDLVYTSTAELLQ